MCCQQEPAITWRRVGLEKGEALVVLPLPPPHHLLLLLLLLELPRRT